MFLQTGNRLDGDPMQKTVKTMVTFAGLGLHSGRVVSLTILPAAAEFGIWFKRTDVTGKDPMIAAHWQNAQHSALCTRLMNDDNVSVATVEHLMAALFGCGISNALVEINAEEMPILDGSSVEFVRGILRVGIVEQN